jgi:chorismate mutase
VSAGEGIAKIRRRIDEIDSEIVRLLSERARCALEIGRIKRELGVPVYDPERERQIVERVVRANAGPLGEDALRRLYERVLDESRRAERLAAEEPDPEGKSR